MKPIKEHLKVIAFFFATLILFQGCTVYQSAPITIEEASKSNSMVRVKTFNKESLKFDRIEVVNNKIYGIKINKSEEDITQIEKDNIEKIQLKDKPMSTILSVAIPVVITGGMLIFFVKESSEVSISY